MTGNDIVDLQIARIPRGEKKTRFLNKIFTEQEREKLSSHLTEEEVWSLWAMKESIYKAHHRRFNLPRSFDPKKIEIFPPENYNGFILFRGEYLGFKYSGSGTISKNYIHCSATAFPQIKTYEAICCSSNELKTNLILAISKEFGLKCKDMSIIKDENFIPQLWYKNTRLNLPFSISNHGKYAAFSFQLMNY